MRKLMFTESEDAFRWLWPLHPFFGLTFPEILEQWLGGSIDMEQAHRDAIRGWHRLVVASLRGYWLTADDHDDIHAELLKRIEDKSLWAKYDPSRVKVQTYFGRVSRNICNEMLREREATLDDCSLVSATNGSHAVERADRACHIEIIRAWLGILGPKQLAALLRKYPFLAASGAHVANAAGNHKVNVSHAIRRLADHAAALGLSG
jgi:hypothetical protein